MLDNLTPMLGVTDVQKSIDFYADALGFQEIGRFEHDGALRWAHLVSGRSDLMLTQMDDIGSASEARKQMSLYFYSDDVVSLHTSLREKDYHITDLRVTFYKMKEFALEDPDGYQLLFGEDTNDPPNCD